MNEFWFLLFAIVASLLTFLVMVLAILKKMNSKDGLMLQMELRKQRQEYFLPNRVEAIQRVILYLERIHPASLIMRVNQPGMSAIVLQTTLLKTIREEYDHNVAQQIFISNKNWVLLKNAKEETVKIINIAASNVTPESTSMDLSSAILAITAEVMPLPSEIAIEAIKEELQLLF